MKFRAGSIGMGPRAVGTQKPKNLKFRFFLETAYGPVSETVFGTHDWNKFIKPEELEKYLTGLKKIG